MIDSLVLGFRRHAARRVRFRPALLGGFALLTVLSGCSALGAIDELTPDSGYHLRAGVAYGDNPRQRLDVYRPEKAGSPAPVIVFFYGGGWRDGARGDYRFVGQAFAADGYIVVVADYRLYPEVRFPGFVEDGAAAVAWVQKHIAAEGGDPGRIILVGHSAGAHLVSMLHADRRFLDEAGFLRPSDGGPGIAATVGMAGPYDYKPEGRYRAILDAEAAGRPVMPMPFIDGKEPPLLLLHGESDSTVHLTNTQALAQKTREKGGQVDVRLYALGHGPLVAGLAQPLRWLGPMHDDILVWLKSKGLAPANSGPS